MKLKTVTLVPKRFHYKTLANVLGPDGERRIIAHEYIAHTANPVGNHAWVFFGYTEDGHLTFLKYAADVVEFTVGENVEGEVNSLQTEDFVEIPVSFHLQGVTKDVSPKSVEK